MRYIFVHRVASSTRCILKSVKDRAQSHRLLQNPKLKTHSKNKHQRRYEDKIRRSIFVRSETINQLWHLHPQISRRWHLPFLNAPPYDRERGFLLKRKKGFVMDLDRPEHQHLLFLAQLDFDGAVRFDRFSDLLDPDLQPPWENGRFTTILRYLASDDNRLQ